jgi:formamidopyrimidine-DNA glycosylase
MPELPEVETIVRGLQRTVPGATIKKVTVKHPNVILAETPVQFTRTLRNRRMEKVERRAKQIVIHLDDQSHLVISLGMTGKVLVADAARAKQQKYVAVRFDLEDGRVMLYDDVRRFGRLEHFAPEHWDRRAMEFGVEPLSAAFTAQRLFELTRLSISPIRNWLLDPYRVAGIGNIYANEALYRSGIRPTRRADKLTRAECVKLRDEIRYVLQAAIDKRGTSMSDYVDADGEEGGYWDLRQVYARESEPCGRCKTPIKRIVLSNRSAFYCPKCQK